MKMFIYFTDEETVLPIDDKEDPFEVVSSVRKKFPSRRWILFSKSKDGEYKTILHDIKNNNERSPLKIVGYGFLIMIIMILLVMLFL